MVFAHNKVDFCHQTNAFGGRMTGAWDGDHYIADYGVMEHTRETWSRRL